MDRGSGAKWVWCCWLPLDSEASFISVGPFGDERSEAGGAVDHDAGAQGPAIFVLPPSPKWCRAIPGQISDWRIPVRFLIRLYTMIGAMMGSPSFSHWPGSWEACKAFCALPIARKFDHLTREKAHSSFS